MAETSPFKYTKADDSAGFLLWKITALWQRKLAAVLGEFEITQTQYAILASLKWHEEQNEKITQTHLVDHTKIDKMTVSKALRNLEQSGLVAREQSVSDNRASNVNFTTQGKKIIHRAIIAVEKADDEFFSCLADKQLELYKTLTSLVIKSNVIT